MLAFVARRIEADAIAMLITSREAIPRSLRGAGLPQRRLAPLARTRRRRSCTRATRALPPATRKRILAAGAGQSARAGGAARGRRAGEPETALPTWLPLSTRLERTFAARVADLPQATRTALLVAALTDRADVTEVLAAASRISEQPLGLDVLTPAVDAGLVELAELRVRFGHPLMRSAIAQGGPEHERRAAHAALAETFADDPARAIWHRVAAALGTDDALADELAARRKTHAAPRLGGHARRRRSAAPPR